LGIKVSDCHLVPVILRTRVSQTGESPGSDDEGWQAQSEETRRAIWPEPAHSRLFVEERVCGAPVARITVIRW